MLAELRCGSKRIQPSTGYNTKSLWSKGLLCNLGNLLGLILGCIFRHRILNIRWLLNFDQLRYLLCLVGILYT